MDVNDSDTKTQIFNTALRLFAANGYENVSIRNIADVVGIKTSSIYYHYGSKEEILDDCYNFYLEHRHDTRLEKDQYEPIIRSGTKEEVFATVNYLFSEEVIENMVLTLFIIFSRMYTDTKAKEIYMDEINCSMKYLGEFFNFGVQIGRFHEFNIPAVSLVILSFKMFIGQSILIEPEQTSSWQKAEKESCSELPKLIPFKY
ncbi:TetR/AcrR family transcriptional regulator [Selenomonadales bacterium OttesenSCG-928-I06]|nr:TetR/AcrR family transcriptional regulator [Selenomonadales bacterium OttesenSCG-928-I06]